MGDKKLMKYISEIRQVQCKQRLLEYELIRKPVKNINLRIKVDGKIYVSANKRVASDFIDNFIKEKQDYIIDALERFEERKTRSKIVTGQREYLSGERFNILGQALVLQVIQGKHESVTYDEEFIYITVKDEDDLRRKENLINKWLKELQVETFDQSSREVHQLFIKYNLKYPVIRTRKMKSRWGSCQYKKGIITLNSRLIEVPIRCIQYVILHEFAHFIHPNHSKRFYDFVGSLMPDWKDRKKELEMWS